MIVGVSLGPWEISWISERQEKKRGFGIYPVRGMTPVSLSGLIYRGDVYRDWVARERRSPSIRSSTGFKMAQSS